VRGREIVHHHRREIMDAMRWQAVRWIHNHADEPSTIYSELDGVGNEVRKVEEYRTGHLDLADVTTETGTTTLSESPIPSLNEINAQPEFEARAIRKEEFEAIWQRAWAWFERD
jgi:hypothetical protein